MASSADRSPQLDLLTRPGCHLCDEMRELLERVLPEIGLDYRVVDVDTDPDLSDRFGDTIPVLLRDGRPVAKVRLDERKLRRIVHRRRLWSG